MRTVFLIMLFTFVAIGCANKSIKPTILPDGTKGFIATCDSTKMSDCYDAAYKECHEGYGITANKKSSEVGNLTFQCKDQVGDHVKETIFQQIFK